MSLPDISNELTGTVQRVTYHDEQSLYTVLRLDSPQGVITVVGNFAVVAPGEELVLQGEWEFHATYGRQFRVHSYRQQAPVSVAGIERYLSSNLVKGVGPALARRLVNHFGEDTLKVIAEDPQRLTEVPGLGTKRRKILQDAVATHRAIQDIMVFLHGLGASPSLATRIYKRYGAQTLSVLRTNPYRLADEVWGIGFATADNLARTLGIAVDAPERARAATMHLLQLASGEGHMYLPLEQLTQRASTLNVAPELCQAAVLDLARTGRLVLEGENQAVYLPRLHWAEREVARLLLDLHNAAPIMRPERQELAVDAEPSMALSAEQHRAVAAAMQGGVTVITGGPGTGKTTIVREIVNQATLAGMRLSLAAPTGRAAKRLEEATSVKARTIHRLLEYTIGAGGTPTFERNANNPLPVDLLVIDEVSMLDLPLASQLLQAVPLGAALVLVGDADQLPPVGPGSFLRDVLAAAVVRVVRLTHIFRQAQQSMIVMNAHRINTGSMPVINRQNADFFYIEERETAKLAPIIRDLVAERLPNYIGSNPSDIQVLTPVRQGPAGVEQLNKVLQATLNPAARSDRKREYGPFYPSDRVMQLRNNYNRMVFNGDIGVVSEIDDESGIVCVNYPDREDNLPVMYEQDELDELELAYATSVHKSQGSEFPVVVFPLVWTMPALMTRNLLYTAITRARKLVVLVGDKRALQAYVRNDTSQQRYSELNRRLNE